MACALGWVLGGLLATAPFLLALGSSDSDSSGSSSSSSSDSDSSSDSSDDDNRHVFSQTSLCVPLSGAATPVDMAGAGFVSGVLVALNLALFSLAAAGQALVLVALSRQQLAFVRSAARSRHLHAAHRLLAPVAARCACWVPGCLLGALAWGGGGGGGRGGGGGGGGGVPTQVSAGWTVLALPLSAALGPCLHVLNVYRERGRREREEKLLRWMRLAARHNADK